MNTLLCIFALLLTIKIISCDEKVRDTNQDGTILETITNIRKFVMKNIKILENVEEDLFHNINRIDIKNDIYKINGVLELSRELNDVSRKARVEKDSDKTRFLLKFCYPMKDYALFQITGKLQTEISRYVLSYKLMWLEIFNSLTIPFLENMEERYSKESRKKLLECASSSQNEFCEIYSADVKELNNWVKDIMSKSYDLGAIIDASKEELFKQDLTKLIETILLDPLHECMHNSQVDCELNPYTILSWKLDDC